LGYLSQTRKSTTGFSIYPCESLLQDLQVPYLKLVLLYHDNQYDVYITSNQVFHERTKYIEIDRYIVREKKMSNGLLKLIPTILSLKATNIFTKLLAPIVFKNLHSKQGMRNIYSQLDGGLINYILFLDLSFLFGP